MPPLPLQYTPLSLKSIHLLRALLRETTYLPDAQARSYFRRYVVDRFRAYQPKPSTSDVRLSVINQRTRPLQRKARKGLNYLRRANLGEPPCVEKILLIAYGRLGRRRYALLERLLQPDPVANAQEGVTAIPEPAPLQKIYHSNKRWLQFFDAPKKVSDSKHIIDISNRYPLLKTVLKSQVQQGIALGRDIKQPVLKTRIYNVWERPMPIKRARNDVKRWYAATMSKLLPPLPNDEWDRIRALATGDTKWRDSVPRRSPARELTPQLDGDHATSRGILLEGLALNKPSKADMPRGKQRPREFTSRMMRRLYARLLSLSCKLEFSNERNKWTAVWGAFRDIKPAVYSTPVDEVLFAGVDKSGHSIKDPDIECPS